MDSNTLKVLLIEDNPGDARLIAEMLRGAVPKRIEIEHVKDLTAGVQRLADDDIEVVLLDLYLPESQGVETYSAVRSAAPHMPVVVLTGKDDEGALAGELLKAGAQDYLVKGQVDARLLARSLRYAVERGRIERQLRERAHELAEAARRKDEFLAVLAHELRNPLAPISMALGLLRRDDVSPQQREWSYEMIGRQTRHMSRLIDDLLDASRISRGKIVLQKQVIDLTTVAQRAAEATLSIMNDRKHNFSVKVPPAGSITVEADAVRLEQIVVNLLTNAAKFTEPNGRIDLHVEAADGWAKIRVQDSGAGIPHDMLEQIFELFAQIERSTSRPSQWGLGIGLSLVRGLVELHGGTVKAHSAGLGQGSEFVVTLPVAARSIADFTPSDDSILNRPADRSQAMRVLIVDDQREFAITTGNLLSSYGYQVSIADDGRQAISTARHWRPEIVLLDIGMPGMDGCEVAQALRSIPEARDALLIAVTGYGRDEDRKRCADAGFDAHLVKPVTPEDLLELLNNHVPERAGERL